MSSAMAISEGKPILPNTPYDIETLREEISHLSKKLDVEGHLTAFQKTITVLDGSRSFNKSHYFLLELSPSEGTVKVTGYKQTQLAIASSDYMTLEKRIANQNKNAVLVSADSVDAL